MQRRFSAGGVVYKEENGKKALAFDSAKKQ